MAGFCDSVRFWNVAIPGQLAVGQPQPFIGDFVPIDVAEDEA